MGRRRKGEDKGISFDRIKKLSCDSSATVHFVGVGGVSMYSLARLTLHHGATVSGSDREACRYTELLTEAGAKIYIGHHPDNVEGASLVVYSHAIGADNPELVRASELMIPTVSRAEYMGALMLAYKKRIGVSGSHGKSTVTAMLDAIFTTSGCNVSVLSGADLPCGEPIKIGGEELLVYEACEYRDSFLRFSPTAAIGLNLEMDHTDYFESLNAIKDSFKKAMSRASDFTLINGDDENFRPIIKQITGRVVTFGQGAACDYRYSVIAFRDKGFDFEISHHGESIGVFRLNIPGVFNVSSAVAAIVTALEYGIDAEKAKEAIKAYQGIPRRLERVGARYNRAVYYDYAHHPTEIAASISALKLLSGDELTVIFKPHTYSRTASLWEEFKSALSLADYVILTPIFPAREEAIVGVSSERLAYEIGAKARFAVDSDIIRYLDLNTHGTIVIMGAGDMTKIKKDVLYKYV